MSSDINGRAPLPVEPPGTLVGGRLGPEGPDRLSIPDDPERPLGTVVDESGVFHDIRIVAVTLPPDDHTSMRVNLAYSFSDPVPEAWRECFAKRLAALEQGRYSPPVVTNEGVSIALYRDQAVEPWISRIEKMVMAACSFANISYRNRTHC